jgi:Chromo (CHRromatin Organisation MOdifier) domain/Integrase core domain
MPIPTRPFESIALDFVGPLPKSNGKQIIMSAMCRFIGMVWLIALPKEFKAVDAADAFIKFIYPWTGLPDSFVSDRDPRFTSHFWRQVCAHLGISQLMSTAFHQQTNGQLERIHRNLGDKLRVYCSQKPTTWLSNLPLFAGAINQAARSDIGKSPIELLTGIPIKTLNETEPIRSEVPAADEFVKLNQIELAEARDAMIVARHRQWTRSGGRRNAKVKFEEGDSVWLKRMDSERRKKKFEPLWTGPYRILQTDEDTGNCKLDFTSDSKRKRNIYPWVASDRLKAFKGQEDDALDLEPDSEEPEYEIESIIDSDEVIQPDSSKKRFYRIRWKGYEEDEDTWEPEENLENAIDMISEYWQSPHAKGKYTQTMHTEIEQYQSEFDTASDEEMDSFFYPSDDSSVCSFGTYCMILGDEYADTY